MKKIKFLKNKSPHFIAFLMPLLRPIKVENKRFIYSDGDPIDEIYFLAKGLAGYVLNNKYENAVYYVINEGQYFGEIDFIFCDNENNNDGKRKFSAMAIGNNDCELLVLKKIDLLQADLEFEEVISDLFQNAAHRLKRTIKLKKRCKAFYKNMKRQQLN
jgi:CRP-like cAMP-binding protein